MKKNKKLTTDEFVERSRRVHGNKYDYSNVIYVNSHNMVEITCPVHGGFYQRPYGHLYGYGCVKCASNNRLQNIPKTSNTFIKESRKVHGNVYDYSIVEYKTALKKVKIVCKIHGIFLQKPNKHLFGQGCPKCKCGYKVSKPETLFLNLLKITRRQKHIGGFKVDGIKKSRIYEFLGDYWHGNPQKFNPNDVNQISKKTFGELYKNTIDKFNRLNDLSYSIYYMWENEWNFWNKNKNTPFPIRQFKKIPI